METFCHDRHPRTDPLSRRAGGQRGRAATGGGPPLPCKEIPATTTGFTFVETLLTGGLAAWMTMAVGNTIPDPGTNAGLPGRMPGMDAIRADAAMGNGLEWRALPAGPAPALPGLVIAVQLAVAVLV